jgi:hypothetical protein
VSAFSPSSFFPEWLPGKLIIITVFGERGQVFFGGNLPGLPDEGAYVTLAGKVDG